MRRLPPAALLLAALLLPVVLTAGCDTYPIEFRPPQETGSDLLYVCNQDAASVAVIDMRRNVLLRTVDLQRYGFSPRARPHHIVVEPDGSFWYVSLIGENKLAKFDRRDRLVGTAEIETPGMLALHPTQDLLFVGRSMTAVRPPASLGVLRRSDLSLQEVPVFFPKPHALVVGPQGSHVYTASLTQNQIMTVDVATHAVGFAAMEGPPQGFVQFAAAPDGQTLYLAGELSDQVHVYSLSDPAAPRLLRSIPVHGGPWDPVFTPDGRFVFVPLKMANTVAVIDAARRTVVQRIQGTGLAEPHASAVSPDGRYVYISNNNLQGTYTPRHTAGPAGTVVVIDAATHVIVKVIEVGANPTGMGRAAGL